MDSPMIVPTHTLRPGRSNPRGELLGIDELAASLHALGVLQPLLVRPIEGWDGEGELAAYEIVCGHRRFAAAQRAGLKDVPVVVRQFSSEEAVLEAQAAENMGRMDMTPLEEAAAARSMLDAGATLDQVAEKLGKTKPQIRVRLALLDLAPETQDALRKDLISVPLALAIGRIADHEQQAEATSLLMEPDERRALSIGAATAMIERRYLMRLASAPFDISAHLAPMPCGECPKRTSAQGSLFGLVPEDDCCTDRTCYQGKVSQAYEAMRKIAAEQEVPELPADQVAAVFGQGAIERPVYGSGFVLPSDRHPEDKLGRTWGELFAAEDEAMPVTLAKSPAGAPVMLLDEKRAATMLKKLGADITTPDEEKARIKAERKARRETVATDAAAAHAIVSAVRAGGLTIGGWQAILAAVVRGADGFTPEHRAILERLAESSLSLYELQAGIVEALLINEAKAESSKALLAALEATCEIDRTALVVEPKPRKKAAKAAEVDAT